VPQELSLMRTLEDVRLDGNPLGDALVDRACPLGDLHRLQNLSLCLTGLESVPWFLARLPSLQSLSLARNVIVWDAAVLALPMSLQRLNGQGQWEKKRGWDAVDDSEERQGGLSTVLSSPVEVRAAVARVVDSAALHADVPPSLQGDVLPEHYHDALDADASEPPSQARAQSISQSLTASTLARDLRHASNDAATRDKEFIEDLQARLVDHLNGVATDEAPSPPSPSVALQDLLSLLDECAASLAGAQVASAWLRARRFARVPSEGERAADADASEVEVLGVDVIPDPEDDPVHRAAASDASNAEARFVDAWSWLLELEDRIFGIASLPPSEWATLKIPTGARRPGVSDRTLRHLVMAFRSWRDAVAPPAPPSLTDTQSEPTQGSCPSTPILV
jgi:hypothetical protein